MLRQAQHERLNLTALDLRPGPGGVAGWQAVRGGGKAIPPSPPFPKGGRGPCGWRLSTLLLPALLLPALPPPAAHAAPPPAQDTAVQQVLRKAQGALRLLGEEKARLEADNAALQQAKAAAEEKAAKLEERAKQLEPLPAELDRQKAANEALKAEKAALQGQLSQAQARHAEVRGRLKDIVEKAKLIQADNRLLVGAVKEREQWVEGCGQKNAKLAELQSELAGRYEDKGFWDVLKDAEPLTGIGRVETENAAQDYRFTLQDLKATPFESQIPPAQEDAARQGKPQAAAEDDDEE